MDRVGVTPFSAARRWYRACANVDCDCDDVNVFAYELLK